MFVGDSSTMVRGVVDLVLGVLVGGDIITVRIYKQSDTLSAEVKNPATNETVMSVPLASLSNITKLVESIAQHLSANAAARLSWLPAAPLPAKSSSLIQSNSSAPWKRCRPHPLVPSSDLLE